MRTANGGMITREGESNARNGHLHGLRWGVLGIILLFFVLQMAEIRQINTLRGDETFYIQAAYNMIQNGDWLVPRYESGELRLLKPIATYWAVGASMQILGFNLADARLPSVLATLAVFPFIYGLGRVLLNDRRAALFAVIAHASTKVVYSVANQARTDAFLSFFVTAAIYYFARLLFTEGRSRSSAILAYAATAGALLTKGGAALIFVFLPLAVFLALSWKRLEPARRRFIFSPWAVVVLLALILPWYGYVALNHGQQFWQSLYSDQIESKLGGNGKAFFISSLLGYIGLCFTETFPWGVLICLGLLTGVSVVRDAVRERRLQWLFLFVWFATALAAFSFGNMVRGRYLLPVTPAVSLFVGFMLSRGCDDGMIRRFLTWGLYAFTGFAALIMTGFLGMMTGILVATVGPIAGTWAVLPLAAGPVFCLFARRVPSVAAFGLAAMMISTTYCWFAIYARPAPLVPLSQISRDVVARQPQDTHIALVGDQKSSGTIMLLYAGRRPAETLYGKDVQDKVRFVRKNLERPGSKLVVLDDQLYNVLPADILANVKIIASRSGVDRIGLERWVLGRYAERYNFLLGHRMSVHLIGTAADQPHPSAETAAGNP